MLRTVKATLEADGSVRLHEQVQVPFPCRAIVTILDEPEDFETALLSQESLAQDWERPEEDAAWSHLQ
ncbi:hypothetical protein SAMN05660653_01181 [Desulfonatronum thiosulfatophilum]|uniref:Uncharacterized protein n=1 Tax=Desulfonatronum thiosulfatophilum TaxID=617002 RepID=A0A1G6BX07_9BACT|nr:hypothetical protein [Desulfonatronum thiosulfatophilum]SDB25151.1 hypothetical protein SAMN05660653_01181 [Desulfonatronum thiosulfatophilum]